MANEKGLDELIKKMDSFHQEAGIKTPNGKSDQEEIQYTEMDLIAGICSAALFGASNKNKDNFKSLLSNPDKSSYLGKIFNHLSLTDKYLKEKIFKNINTPIGVTNNGAIKVHLESINKNLYDENTPFIVSSIIQQNQTPEINTSDNKDIIGKILLEIDNSDNLENIVNSLNKLKDFDVTTYSSNIKELTNNIDILNQLPNTNFDGDVFIKSLQSYLNKLKALTIPDNIVQINEFINSVNNLPEIKPKSISDQYIQNISENFNEFEKINIPDNIKQISDFINSINTLPEVKMENLNDDYINKLSNYFINFEKINIPDNVKKISDFINSINNLPEIKIENLNGDYINKLSDYFINFEKINIPDNVQDIINFINNLSKIKEINYDKQMTQNILEYIESLTKIKIPNNFYISVNQLNDINNLITFINGLQEIKKINYDKENLQNIFNYIGKISQIVIPAKIKNIENIDQINNLINSINTNLPEFKIINYDKSSIDNFIKFIEDISKININKINVPDNIDDIIKFVGILNNLPTIDNVNYNDQLIIDLQNYINKLSNISIPEIQNKENIENLYSLTNSLNNINDIFNKINIDKSPVDFIDDITNFLDQISNLETDDNIDYNKIGNNIEKLNKIFINVDKNEDNKTFSSLFKNISEVIKDINFANKNIEALNTVLKTILFVVNNDQKINTKSLNTLIRITKKGGTIDTLFKQLSELTSEKNIKTEPIRSLQTYFDTISSLGEIGLIKRMRILNNIKFFNTFINRHLPALIEDINKRFSNITDINKIPGLYSLSQLFEFISNIGDISLNNKMRLKFNLLFIRYFILDDVLNMIKDFNDTLKNELKNIEIDKITNVFNSLLNIAQIEPEKLDNSQYTLKELHNLIYNKKYSLISLLTKINENTGIFDTSIDTIDNMQLSIESLIELVNNLKLDDKIILNFIKSGSLLRLTELPLISSIINYINEEINSSNNTKEIIENIYKQYFNPLDILNSNILNLDDDYKLIRSILENLNKEIKNINELLKLTSKLKDSYNNVDKDIFDNINNFLSKLKIENNIVDNSKVINDLSIGIINLVTLLDYLNNIQIPDNDILKNLSEFITNLINYFNKINSFENDVIKKIIISDDSISKLENFKKSIKIIMDLNKDIKEITKIGTLLKPFESVLNKESEIINTFIRGFDKIDAEKIKAANDVINELSKLLLFSTAVLLIGAMAMQFVNIMDLLEFTAVLGIFVLAMSGICIMISKTFGDKNLDNFSVAIEGLMEIVLKSSAVLLLGSLIMNFIDPGNLVLFAITLGGFVLLMSGVMAIISSLDIEKLKTLSEDFGILVMILAGTLIVGSILTSLVKFENLLKFAANLTGFMIALYVPLLLYTKIDGKMVEGAREFGELVFMCGMTLALGALITHFVNWKDLLAFAINLGIFIAYLSIPLLILSLGGGKILMQGAKELGMVVLMSAAALIIGGLFMQIDGLWLESLKFAGILGGFIGLISIAIGLGSLIAGGKGLQFGKDLVSLVLISSAVLLIGGALFMNYPELPKNVIYFGIILCGFVSLISIAFGFAGKLLGGKGIAMALALSLLITISATTLILGPYLIQQAGIDYLDILKFAGITLGYVTLFGIILGVMGIFAPNIGLGLLCVAGIGLVTLGMAWVFQESYKMLSTINWDNFWEQWENVGILFGIIGGVVAILGSIMYTGVGAVILAAGAAALATFEALIYGMGKCVQAAAIGIMYLKNIENENVEKLMKPFGDFIKYGTEVIWDNLSLKKIAFLKTASGAIQDLGKVISQISKAVQEYAELKIPIYDNNGKISGYRNLTNEDFTNAATNIATIITCVGGAIMGLFGLGPMASNMTEDQKEVAMEMLKVESSGLFRSNKTKFGMIVEASAGLGKVIKEIADGTITWNKLPENFDTNKAAINIATIITCVGGAIMGLFGLGPMASNMTEEQKAVALEMLETTGSGFLGLGPKKTKFGLILEATEHIGDIIKSIGEGSMAFSKLPEGFDVVKIGSNVGTIVTTLGEALISLYDRPIGKEMFKTDNIFTGNNKFKRVADSVGQLGSMISNIMEGVQSYANLKIPTKFDKEGKPIDWRPMTNLDFFLAQYNIGRLVTTLGEALTKVAESDIFKSIYGGVQLKNISEAIVNVSKVISPIAESIWMYATGNFPKLEYKDGNLVTSGYFDTKKYGGIRKVINVATNNIGLVIKGLAQKIGELLEDDSLEFLYDDVENIKIFTESLSLLTNSVNSIFKILGEILQNPLPSGLISLFITTPLSTFIEGVLFKNKNEELVEWLIDEYDDELEDYTEALSLLSRTIKTVFGSIKDIIDMNLTNEQVSQIPTMLSSYLSLTDTINGFTAKYTEETSESINRYIEDINKFVELAKNTKEEYAERYNILRDGINAIYLATSAITNNEAFSSHAETLEKYVKAVNSIQISKVQSLTNLAEAVTVLGNKIGNIDNFTNTLANKVSNVLIKLTSQIKEAELVIKNADALHKKREELIKKSVGEVTKLMQQDMTVKIEKVDESTDESKDTTSGTPVTDDENKTSGGNNNGTETSKENDKNDSDNSIAKTVSKIIKPISPSSEDHNLLVEINNFLHKKLK